MMTLPERVGAATAPVASPPPATPRLRVHAEGDPGRPEVEAFIRGVYAERHGAQVRRFAPVLVSLRDGDRVVAAAGYRHATHEPLFLERYLDAPVDSLLARHSGAPTARGGIVEVGHLAANRAGEGRRLILLLGPHLAARRCEWVVSTLTEELHHLFLRIGVTPIELGVADPAALGDEARYWGRYYDCRPMVLAGHLPGALSELARRRLVDGTTA